MRKFFLGIVILLIAAGCSTNKNISTNHKEDKSKDIALYYYSMAETAYQNKDYPAAISLFKKADSYDQKNIYIKNRIMEIMDQRAVLDHSLFNEIITLGEDYYQRGFYNDEILLILAKSYFGLQDFESTEKYLKLSLEENSTMKTYIFYLILLEKQEKEIDPDLVNEALESPWNDLQEVMFIAEIISEYDIPRAVAVLDSAQTIWNNENILRMQVSLLETINADEEAITRLERRIFSGEQTSDKLKLYLLGFYFKNYKFQKIYENKALCEEVGTDQALRYLFMAAMALNEMETALESAEAIEQLGTIPNNIRSSFYGYYGYVLFRNDKWEEVANKLILCDDINFILELIAENGLIIDTDRANVDKILDFLQQKNIHPDFNNFLSGYIYSLLEDSDLSNSYLDKVPEEYLKRHDLLLTSAIAYLSNTGEHEKPQQLLALRDVQKPSFKQVLAQYYYTNQQDSLAYDYFKEILTEEEMPEMGLFMLASILGETLGDHENLLVILEKGVSLYPDNADILNALGYLIADNEITASYDRAEELLSKAVELDPDNEMILDSYAWLLYKMNRYDEALRVMEKPLDRGIDNSEIAYHLGEIYLKLDQKDDARKWFEKAVELNNEESAVNQAEQRLVEIE